MKYRQRVYLLQGKSHQGFKSFPSQRKNTPRYQSFFYGHYFCCNIFGHKVVECKYSKIIPPSQNKETKEGTQTLKENKNKEVEDFRFSLYAQGQGNTWHIENMYSMHMERDKNNANRGTNQGKSRIMNPSRRFFSCKYESNKLSNSSEGDLERYNSNYFIMDFP